MAAALARAGVDIRPEAMGVTWDDVGEALRTLGAYVREAGLWFTVADVVPVTDAHLARVRELVDGGPSADRRRRHEARADAAAGLRPGVPRRRRGDRVAADRRGRPLGRGHRVRVALGLRPHAGRPAAGGGADLRAVRRARRARRGDAPGAARAPRPRGRVPERRPDGQGDLDARRRSAAAGRSSASARAGRKTSGWPTATASRRRRSGWRSSPTSSRSSPGCSARAARRGTGSHAPTSTTRSTSRRASSSRASRSSSAATGRR